MSPHKMTIARYRQFFWHAKMVKVFSLLCVPLSDTNHTPCPGDPPNLVGHKSCPVLLCSVGYRRPAKIDWGLLGHKPCGFIFILATRRGFARLSVVGSVEVYLWGQTG